MPGIRLTWRALHWSQNHDPDNKPLSIRLTRQLNWQMNALAGLDWANGRKWHGGEEYEALARLRTHSSDQHREHPASTSFQPPSCISRTSLPDGSHLMSAQYDLVIRNGLIVDGTGSDPFAADVAVTGSKIAAVGAVGGSGKIEIDAADQIVTPGFIDLHTHLDGHVTWEAQLHPISGHGVTTAVIGNCGVGFAPCHPEDRDMLIRLMETVEDIAFADLSKGLPWNWETYPEYLDALAARSYNMDIATLLPHSTMRSYVMGERSLTDKANEADLSQLADIAKRGIAAGAIGFGTSTLRDQRTSDGRHIPSVLADETEFAAIAEGMRDGGGGVLQVAIEFNQFPLACEELKMFGRIGKLSGRPIMFSLKQTNKATNGWRDLLEISDRMNAEGIDMHPQVLGRPTGALMSLQSTLNPFSRCLAYDAIAALPLAERVEAMRKPEMRASLIAQLDQAQAKLPERVRGFSLVFPLMDPPNYEPARADSVQAMADSRGVSAADLVYDLLLEDDGKNWLLLAGGNYADFSLEPSLVMMQNPHSVPGLGDAGAHSGIICDASISTYMLSYWARDRKRGAQLPLAQVIKWLTSDCARVIGFKDRGTIAVGMKADLNVIDHANIRLCSPRVTHDLPAGGTRLVQDAKGYTATIVSGVIVHRDDCATDALPGRLVRRS
jgi:N-acyl-D-amino-acid deacylase